MVHSGMHSGMRTLGFKEKKFIGQTSSLIKFMIESLSSTIRFDIYPQISGRTAAAWIVVALERQWM